MSNTKPSVILSLSCFRYYSPLLDLPTNFNNDHVSHPYFGRSIVIHPLSDTVKIARIDMSA
jgi:hypothetical protein